MRKLFELEAVALAAEDTLIEQKIRERREYERTHCRRCGREIIDWDEVVQTDSALIQHYHCSCGYWGNLYYKLTYVDNY